MSMNIICPLNVHIRVWKINNYLNWKRNDKKKKKPKFEIIKNIMSKTRSF